MCTKFILLGDFGSETAAARATMDARGIPYRFELSADPEEAPTLLTPGGNFHGARAITRMFAGVSEPSDAPARRE